MMNGFALIISSYFLLLVNGLTLSGDEQRKKLSLPSMSFITFYLQIFFFPQSLGKVFGISTLKLQNQKGGRVYLPTLVAI